MRLSDISDTKTLRAGFPDICRAIKEKETDMEVTEKNRTKYRMPGEFEPMSIDENSEIKLIPKTVHFALVDFKVKV